MHPAASDYVAAAVSELGPFSSVVEIGSRDMNGSVRRLFGEARRYIGLDVEPGPGVDVVGDPADWHPGELVEAVVCCEVLEHVQAWPEVLEHAARFLVAGGKLILTAAGPGRRPHSGITGRRRLEPGEFYRNVEPLELVAALEAAGFVDVEIDVFGNDVRATAARRVRTVVGIPFLNELERTRAVLEIVLEDPAVDLVVLDDNGSTDPAVASWLWSLEALESFVLRRPSTAGIVVNRRPPLEDGGSLYELWNGVVKLAQGFAGRGPVNVALLNNDLRLTPRTVGILADALRSAPAEVAAVYPDYTRALADDVDLGELVPTRGTWTKKGLSGFAFMFRGELMGDVVPFFDTRYRLFYGDGDFVESLEDAGMTAARVSGLPLEHDKSTTVKTEKRWTTPAKRADLEARKAKVAELAT